MTNIIYFLLCALIFLLPILPSKIMLFSFPFSSDYIFIIMLLVYIAKLLISSKERHKFKKYVIDTLKNPVTISMLALFILMIISVSYSLEKGLAVRESIRFFSYLFMFFVIKYELNEDKYYYGILNSYICSSVIVGIIGIYQYFSGFGLTDEFKKEFAFGSKFRIASTLENPNSLAGFMILCIFPVIMLLLKTRQKSKKVMYAACLGLFICNLILSFSKNGWIALAIGAFVLILTVNWKYIYGFIIFAIMSLFIPVVTKRLSDFMNPDQYASRIKHWKVAILMIKDHPIFGVGNGNYVSYYDSYIAKYPELDYAYKKRFPVHNSYLKVESELGILGIISFISFIFLSVKSMAKFIRWKEDSYYNLFFIGSFASTIAFYCMNFVDNMFFVPKVTTFFWIIFAVAQGIIYRKENKIKIIN